MKNKTKFMCIDCNHIFQRQKHLDSHTEKKACKNVKYKCKYCEKGFTTDNSMYRHMKHVCKIKKTDNDKKDEILEKLIKLEEENDKLKQELIRIKQKNKIIYNNSINNNSINNGTINNIILIGYGKEAIANIDKQDILKSLKNGFYSTLHLTEAVHFNPKYPEYHNIYISNIKDKYAMMYDGIEWTLTIKTELIDKLYEDKKNYIEDNMENFIDSLSSSQFNALKRWLIMDNDHAKIKEIKDKIKLLLYNKRDIINCKDG